MVDKAVGKATMIKHINTLSAIAGDKKGAAAAASSAETADCKINRTTAVGKGSKVMCKLLKET